MRAHNFLLHIVASKSINIKQNYEKNCDEFTQLKKPRSMHKSPQITLKPVFESDVAMI
jgi:hypothetical protein